MCASGLRDQNSNPIFGIETGIGRGHSYSGNSPHRRAVVLLHEGSPLWNNSSLDRVF